MFDSGSQPSAAYLDFFFILLPICARFLARLEIQEIGGRVGHRIGGTESA
jgi:hypothetical protein